MEFKGTKELIFIPFSTPSSKNSKVKTSRGVFHSKTVTKYLRALGIQHFSSSKKEIKGYVNKDNIFLEEFLINNWVKPTEQIVLGLHFVRGSRHKADFHNLAQIILDLMVAHDLIEDDNMDWLIPMPFKINNKWYSYDKIHPGVYLKIIKIK